MTANKHFKRRVRARVARTGESYTAALRHLRALRGASVTTMTTHDTPVDQRPVRLRLAVAQTTHRGTFDDVAGFTAAGEEIRRLMSRAHEQGARLIQFCEATLCFPDKRLLSSDPDTVAEADWSRFPWEALRAELDAIATHAGRLGLWTVIGAQHRLSEPHRPHTGLYVIDDQGRVVTRYDERVLSPTKAQFLFTPGTRPVVVEVDGFRLGLTSGLEVHVPELFATYADAGVHGVLFSTAGPGDATHAGAFAREAAAIAAQHAIWVGFAAPTVTAPYAPSGIIAPTTGEWVVRGPEREEPAVVVADLEVAPDDPYRYWRRWMRERMTAAPVSDPRSEQLSSF